MRIPGVSAFLAIVRNQNLNRAATQLSLAQSTVSKRLQALEEEIGMHLVERGKGQRSIQLTSAGEAFIDIAERWDGLLQDMRTLRTAGPTLSLSVGTLDSVINSVFPDIYTELTRHQPKVHLKITTLHSIEAYDIVERRELDVAFSLLELAHSNVHVDNCYHESMVVLRAAQGARKYPKRVHPKDLDTESELYVRWSPGYQLWHDKWWNPYSRGRKNLDTAQLILSCFRSSSEWAIVPHSFARLAQRRGNFAIQQLIEPPPERNVYVLTHRQPKASSMAGIAVFNQCLDSVLKGLAGVVSRD